MLSDRRERRLAFVERLIAVRRERFGNDIELLATALEIPEGTWLNYEAGVNMPAEVMLRFLVLTGTDPEWLLTGRGRPLDDISFGPE
jgi:hypothetical protein